MASIEMEAEDWKSSLADYKGMFHSQDYVKLMRMVHNVSFMI